jgi:hypothetical protein
MLVVMRYVLVQDQPQVPRPGDQHPVGDLRSRASWNATSAGFSLLRHRVRVFGISDTTALKYVHAAHPGRQSVIPR